MTCLISNLVKNLAEGIHKIKCGHDNFIKYNCLFRDKNYSNKIDEKFKKQFKNTFKFRNKDINKFILLLIKGVYCHEYMDEWEKFMKNNCLKQKIFYSNPNMEDTVNSNYNHKKFLK